MRVCFQYSFQDGFLSMNIFEFWCFKKSTADCIGQHCFLIVLTVKLICKYYARINVMRKCCLCCRANSRNGTALSCIHLWTNKVANFFTDKRRP